ncbi:MAG: N-acyl homoserine lactonase family protein [Chloroflexota bacterium]|nr:N-acyl homoserine lactonase family protein [Chloroflexota bacterium]
MSIELMLFQAGAVDIVKRSFHPWLPEAEGSEMFRQPVWSALIKTPEGNILFDTGLHPVHVARPDATFGPLKDMTVVMRDEDAIVRRLEAAGVAPDDVQIVVNSHLHFDHAGNNGAFPRATFIVQADHLVSAKGRQSFPGVYWDLPELTYLPVSGRTRVAKGVEVVPTPGHAVGHQSLVLDLPETGRVVLCGDAANTRANLERGEEPALAPDDAKASLALIRSLVNDDLDRCFPSHDMAAWRSWRHAPEVYR